MAEPKAPNIGRYIIGCGVGSEAFGSPMFAQTIKPPLSTSLGLAPKKAGSQSTRSAILPGAIEPSTWEMPAVMAGLMRDLGHVPQHAEVVVARGRPRGVCRAPFFMVSAVWMARRPSLADAAHGLRVAADHRDRAQVVQHALGDDRLGAHPALGEGHVRGDLGVEVVADHDHVEQFGHRVDAVGQASGWSNWAGRWAGRRP